MLSEHFAQVGWLKPGTWNNLSTTGRFGYKLSTQLQFFFTLKTFSFKFFFIFVYKKISSNQHKRTSTRYENHHNNEGKKSRNKRREREKMEKKNERFVRCFLFCLLGLCFCYSFPSRKGPKWGVRRLESSDAIIFVSLSSLVHLCGFLSSCWTLVRQARMRRTEISFVWTAARFYVCYGFFELLLWKHCRIDVDYLCSSDGQQCEGFSSRKLL